LKRHIFVTHFGVQCPEYEPEFQASDEPLKDDIIEIDHNCIKEEKEDQETEESGNAGSEKLEIRENGQAQSETQGDAKDSIPGDGKNPKSKKITCHVLQSKLLITKAGLLDVYIDDSKEEQVFIKFCLNIFLKGFKTNIGVNDKTYTEFEHVKCFRATTLDLLPLPPCCELLK